MPRSANAQSEPVVATMGTATFIQSGLPGLLRAVHAGARLLLILLDSPMTGDDVRRQLPGLARECGAGLVLQVNPCHQESFRAALNEASDYAGSEAGRIAIVITTRPCALLDSGPFGIEPSREARQAPHGCEQCYDGLAAESRPTSIFELAQQVAMNQKQGGSISYKSAHSAHSQNDK